MPPTPLSRRTVLAAGAAVAGTPLLGRTAASASVPAWRDVPVSLGADVASLDELALVNRHRGWAVGRVPATYDLALAGWDGRAWSRTPLPEPFGGGGAVMAASDRRHLWIMGYGTTHSAFWDGSTWHPADIPNKPGFPVEVGPYSMSASPDGTAWAVLVDVVHDVNVVLRWEDGAWARVDVPVPERGVAQHVAVRTSRDVWISGRVPGAGGSRIPFSLRWNGRSWTSVAVSPPDQPRETQSIKSLLPVSRSLVWAYRSHDAMPTQRTLLRWTGGDSWQEIPVPGGLSYTGGALADDGQGGVWLGGGGHGSTDYAHFRNGAWTVVYGPSRDPEERTSVNGLARVPGTRTIMAAGEIVHRDTGHPSGYGSRPFVERLH